MFHLPHIFPSAFYEGLPSSYFMLAFCATLFKSVSLSSSSSSSLSLLLLTKEKERNKSVVFDLKRMFWFVLFLSLCKRTRKQIKLQSVFGNRVNVLCFICGFKNSLILKKLLVVLKYLLFIRDFRTNMPCREHSSSSSCTPRLQEDHPNQGSFPQGRHS